MKGRVIVQRGERFAVSTDRGSITVFEVQDADRIRIDDMFEGPLRKRGSVYLLNLRSNQPIKVRIKAFDRNPREAARLLAERPAQADDAAPVQRKGQKAGSAGKSSESQESDSLAANL